MHFALLHTVLTLLSLFATLNANPLPAGFEASLAARNETSALDARQIFTGGMCDTNWYNHGVESTCYFGVLDYRDGGSALYLFRNNCELIGYNPGTFINDWFSFNSQLRYSIVVREDSHRRPEFWYAGKYYNIWGPYPSISWIEGTNYNVAWRFGFDC